MAENRRNRVIPIPEQVIVSRSEGLGGIPIQRRVRKATGSGRQRRRSTPPLDVDRVLPQERHEKAARERVWFQTIARVPKSIAIRCLMIGESLRQKEFLKEAEMDEATIRKTRERDNSRYITANSILEAVGLDPIGKAAQLFRLKMIDSDIMSWRGLESSSSGEQVQYLRELLGFSLRDAAESTGVSARQIGRFEAGLRQESMKQYIASLVTGLGLSIEDPFISILFQKIDGESVTIPYPEFIAMSGRSSFLVVKDKDRPVAQYPLTDDDVALKESIDVEAHTCGQALKILRESRNLTQTELSQKIQHVIPVSQKHLSRWESGARVPLDVSIALLAAELDQAYSVHHPIVWKLLELAEQDRERRKTARVQTSS